MYVYTFSPFLCIVYYIENVDTLVESDGGVLGEDLFHFFRAVTFFYVYSRHIRFRVWQLPERMPNVGG